MYSVRGLHLNIERVIGRAAHQLFEVVQEPSTGRVLPAERGFSSTYTYNIM